MARFSDILTDQNLVPIPNVLVTVRNEAGQLAALTADTSDPMANPFVAGPRGEVVYNAPGALYFNEYRYGGRLLREDEVIVGDPPQYIGPAGPAANFRVNLAALKAAPITDRNSIYDRSLWTWETANPPYTADDINTVQANGVSLSIGAWLRQSSSGLAFQQIGAGVTPRNVQDKLRDTLSVRDFGALGDGATNDTAAFNACYGACVAQGKTMHIPGGVYRAYLTITDPGVVIAGDGSAVTIIKLPDGASHTITVEAGSQPSLTGVPCVLDFGQIGDGNSATARAGAHISGLTLDGNKANVTPPSNDLFGWGMVFTAYSGVTYDDVAVRNCHAGGIGTFINSNYHRGSNWQVSGCGFNLGHPGFDVNSSKYSVWSGVVDSSKEGARLLDNCRNNGLDVSIVNCDRTGFIYGNQITGAPGTGNFSENNDIVVRVDGGCSIAGVQVGAKCASGTISADLANVQGVGIQEVKQTATADNPRGIHYQVATIRGGQASCLIGGDSGLWTISTLDDGGAVTSGSSWAVTVSGDGNILSVTYQDSGVKLRGVQFTSTADNNRLVSYTYGTTVQPLSDQGTRNVYRGFKPWQTLTLTSGYSNPYGDGPDPSYRIADDGDVLGIGTITGTAGSTMTTLPAGARPSAKMYFGGGANPFSVSTAGLIVGAGTGPWNLNAMRFVPA